MRAVGFDEAVVEAYAPLLGIAWRYYYHDERAADLASEAVTRALEARQRYDGRPLMTWLRAIMHHVWLNELSRKRTSMERRLGSWDAGGGVESDQRVCVRDTLSVLRRWRGRSVCVDTLIDHVRGMAISEIAEQRGLPSSTVRRRIHEARKLLKKLVNVN